MMLVGFLLVVNGKCIDLCFNVLILNDVKE